MGSSFNSWQSHLLDILNHAYQTQQWTFWCNTTCPKRQCSGFLFSGKGICMKVCVRRNYRSSYNNWYQWFAELNCLANCSLICFCRYPTRDQLTAVAHLIIQTYPALKDQSVGTGYVSLFNICLYYEATVNSKKY